MCRDIKVVSFNLKKVFKVSKVLKKHIQNMMLSVYHTLFQHYALMFLQELQFTGGKRCFCSYLALRDSVGQILPPLQS
ncbi:hypothetical protein E4405_23915 [Salmonella enterica subsp. enterica]|nr:hypothetical protein [Salmonella enterica subsp. enterica]